jgi:hypothetical protein
MEEQAVLMEALYEKARDYTNTTLEIAKLKALDKTSDVISSLVPRIIVWCLLLMFAIIFNIAVSLWLGAIMGQAYYGFLMVSGFYILTAAIVHFLLQPSIKRKISNAIITRLLN